MGGRAEGDARSPPQGFRFGSTDAHFFLPPDAPLGELGGADRRGSDEDPRRAFLPDTRVAIRF